MVINETGQTSDISVNCESRLVDMNVFQDMRYTNEAQRTINPNDNGLIYVASLYNKSIYWGNSAPVESSVAAGPAGNSFEPSDYGPTHLF